MKTTTKRKIALSGTG